MLVTGQVAPCGPVGPVKNESQRGHDRVNRFSREFAVLENHAQPHVGQEMECRALAFTAALNVLFKRFYFKVTVKINTCRSRFRFGNKVIYSERPENRTEIPQESPVGYFSAETRPEFHLNGFDLGKRVVQLLLYLVPVVLQVPERHLADLLGIPSFPAVLTGFRGNFVFLGKLLVMGQRPPVPSVKFREFAKHRLPLFLLFILFGLFGVPARSPGITADSVGYPGHGLFAYELNARMPFVPVLACKPFTVRYLEHHMRRFAGCRRKPGSYPVLGYLYPDPHAPFACRFFGAAAEKFKNLVKPGVDIPFGGIFAAFLHEFLGIVHAQRVQHRLEHAHVSVIFGKLEFLVGYTPLKVHDLCIVPPEGQVLLFLLLLCPERFKVSGRSFPELCRCLVLPYRAPERYPVIDSLYLGFLEALFRFLVMQVHVPLSPFDITFETQHVLEYAAY